MSTLIFAISGPRYMTFWLWAYFMVLSNMQKTDFQNSRGVPILWPCVKISTLIVHANISHLRTYVHQNLAQGQFLVLSSMQKTAFQNFDF